MGDGFKLTLTCQGDAPKTPVRSPGDRIYAVSIVTEPGSTIDMARSEWSSSPREREGSRVTSPTATIRGRGVKRRRRDVPAASTAQRAKRRRPAWDDVPGALDRVWRADDDGESVGENLGFNGNDGHGVEDGWDDEDWGFDGDEGL